MKRMEWIDCVKGLAIIFVVLGHIDMGEHFLCSWIYSFHVPLFFMISGILLAVSQEKNESTAVSIFLLKKAKQLLYPYAVFSLLAVFYLAVRGLWDDLIPAVKDTLCLNGYSTLWFLPALFFSECIFTLIRRSKIPDMAGAALLFLLTVLLSFCNNGVTESLYTGTGYILLNLFNRVCIASLFLLAGYHGYLLSQKSTRLSPGVWIVIGAALFSVNLILSRINGWVDLHFSKVNNPFLYYIFAFTGCLSAILLVRLCIRRNRILEYFGKNSLIVLVTHLPFPIVGYARKLWEMLPVYTRIRYVDDLFICAIILAAEVVLIEGINRFAPFLIRIPQAGTTRLSQKKLLK